MIIGILLWKMPYDRSDNNNISTSVWLLSIEAQSSIEYLWVAQKHNFKLERCPAILSMAFLTELRLKAKFQAFAQIICLLDTELDKW